MNTNHKAIKLGNGYLYRGVHIKRDDEYTNGQEWTYTFVMNATSNNYELCKTLAHAKFEIDALIEQGNYFAEDDWLFHPSMKAAQ